MSLKIFHLFFIAMSTLLCLGLGLWAVDAWRSDGATSWLVLAGLAFVAGGGLVVYGNRFLHKLRKLGVAWLLVAGTLGFPAEALACPACVGSTDSILRTGMNMGIFVLLGVTGFVLVSFASFFIYLVLRARDAAVPGSDLKVSERSM